MPNHKGTVRIETDRLVLRRFVPDDLEQIFHNCWSDYEVWKWTNYAPMENPDDVKTLANMFTEKWLGAYERPDRYSWAIELKETGEVIGRFSACTRTMLFHRWSLPTKLAGNGGIGGL